MMSASARSFLSLVLAVVAGAALTLAVVKSTVKISRYHLQRGLVVMPNGESAEKELLLDTETGRVWWLGYSAKFAPEWHAIEAAK